MEKKITLEEEKKANRIKSDFFEVHGQFSEIQNKISLLNQEAEDLIKKLSFLRNEEFEFIKSLGEKYGEGTLDPFSLTYKINNEKENQ